MAWQMLNFWLWALMVNSWRVVPSYFFSSSLSFRDWKILDGDSKKFSSSLPDCFYVYI